MLFASLRKPKGQHVDFEQDSLPWVDKPTFHTELAKRIASGTVTPEMGDLLRQWESDGFVLLKGVIEPELIDAMLNDHETAWEERPLCKILVEGKGVIDLAEADPREQLTHHHYRLMDFHNLSNAAGNIMLHPEILSFIGQVFDDTPVGMQSLYFEYGSEQHMHQDFAFVHSGILSHLIGVWIAFEESGPQNGGLQYYPGSHKIPKFDFGGGSLLYDNSNPKKLDQFEKHLERECKRHKIEPKMLNVEKGDVLFWHAALVHGGAPTVDTDATRKSFVLHYSSGNAYTRDRRSPDTDPKRIEKNGGVYFAWEQEGHKEGRY